MAKRKVLRSVGNCAVSHLSISLSPQVVVFQHSAVTPLLFSAAVVDNAKSRYTHSPALSLAQVAAERELSKKGREDEEEEKESQIEQVGGEKREEEEEKRASARDDGNFAAACGRARGVGRCMRRWRRRRRRRMKPRLSSSSSPAKLVRQFSCWHPNGRVSISAPAAVFDHNNSTQPAKQLRRRTADT